MSVQNITENMTNPSVATAVGGTTVLANFAGSLPILINVIVAVYFTLMVVHKAYQMWKEYKADTKNEPGE
jgi:hypothetical protein